MTTRDPAACVNQSVAGGVLQYTVNGKVHTWTDRPRKFPWRVRMYLRRGKSVTDIRWCQGHGRKRGPWYRLPDWPDGTAAR